jgi:hypothetical protein
MINWVFLDKFIEEAIKLRDITLTQRSWCTGGAVGDKSQLEVATTNSNLFSLKCLIL